MDLALALSVALKKLAAVVLLLCAWPIKVAIDKLWPDGPVKSFLFKRR